MRSSLLVVLAALASACSGAADCTEIDCNHQAVVTFPPAVTSGPFDLVIASDEGATIAARCLDPTSAEQMANPPEVTCDAGGFELDGHELANARSVRVTITDVATGESSVEGVEVFLDVVDEEQPNGSDCPPTCFVRNGRLAFAGPD